MQLHSQHRPDRFFEDTAWYQRALQSLSKTPSLLALLVQSAAFGVILMYAKMSAPAESALLTADMTFYVFSLVLLQSMFATFIATCVGMAVWWRWIHFFFPLALWLMSILHVPSSVYFIGFVVTMALYWTTFKTQVPFYPSRPAVWQALHNLMQQHRPHHALRMIDIGSGLGDVSTYIAQHRPNDMVEGIEVAPLPWLISKVRAYLKGSRATFTLGSYHALNFADYDVVFAYLSPAAMSQLWEKASQEMRHDTLLVSLEFDIPNVMPEQIIQTGDTTPDLFVWRMA
ncbi:class I SAM-dependent methyltransferase [Methylotenera sp. 1P/1]|uniref:class I SAM-dependent methyltransferase n=1 Tax=Methylotenera sp. 1P/1 TaxID=1131551 RepID=UPI0003813A90|nr:class I SAM-dependent methyltransferase [Methylotenera sp. 1P/1]